MSTKNVAWWCVGTCVCCCVGIASGITAAEMYYKRKIAAMGASNLRIVQRAAALSSELAAVKIDRDTCYGSIQSEEASLEDFYQQLIYAPRIDVVTFREDGSPVRLVFNCNEEEDK